MTPKLGWRGGGSVKFRQSINVFILKGTLAHWASLSRWPRNNHFSHFGVFTCMSFALWIKKNTKVEIKNTNLRNISKAHWNGSAGKHACCQAWQLEVDAWNSHGEGETQQLWLSHKHLGTCVCTHAHIHTQVNMKIVLNINRYFYIVFISLMKITEVLTW